MRVSESGCRDLTSTVLPFARSSSLVSMMYAMYQLSRFFSFASLHSDTCLSMPTAETGPTQRTVTDSQNGVVTQRDVGGKGYDASYCDTGWRARCLAEPDSAAYQRRTQHQWAGLSGRRAQAHRPRHALLYPLVTMAHNGLTACIQL